MAKAYSDDLRRRILQAYEQKEGSEAELARRFQVSLGYVKKIRQQWRRTGKMERVPHQPGRKPKFTEPIRERLRSWLQQQPDLTLMELQEQLRAQERLPVSVPALWVVLRKIGLRLKKSRSTPKSATRKPTGSGGRRSRNRSARFRRKS
jgi:transposase